MSDLFSRIVVVLSMEAKMKLQLVWDTLIIGIWQREPKDRLIDHSDNHNINSVSYVHAKPKVKIKL
jgi:hypothetical protein